MIAALIITLALGLLVFMFIQNKKHEVKNQLLMEKNQQLMKRLVESRKSKHFLFNKAYDLETKLSDQTTVVSILLETIDRLNRNATDRNTVLLANISSLKQQLKQSSTITNDPSCTSEMCGPPPTYSQHVSKYMKVHQSVDPAPSAPPAPDDNDDNIPPPYTKYESVGGF